MFIHTRAGPLCCHTRKGFQTYPVPTLQRRVLPCSIACCSAFSSAMLSLLGCTLYTYSLVLLPVFCWIFYCLALLSESADLLFLWLYCLALMHVFIVLPHSLSLLLGSTAWLYGMGLIHVSIAWLHCMALLPGHAACLYCLALMHVSTAWL
jgi:hypothetical protein